MLQSLAHRLRDSVGKAGLVCRYGGKVFAVILPGASRPEAARIAERLRRAIEQQHIDLRGAVSAADAVQLTASFGVAALEPEIAGVLHRPAQLFTLADRSLHAARRAGRNCVRVFNPKPPSSTAA